MGVEFSEMLVSPEQFGQIPGDLCVIQCSQTMAHFSAHKPGIPAVGAIVMVIGVIRGIARRDENCPALGLQTEIFLLQLPQPLAAVFFQHQTAQLTHLPMERLVNLQYPGEFFINLPLPSGLLVLIPVANGIQLFSGCRQ